MVTKPQTKTDPIGDALHAVTHPAAQHTKTPTPAAEPVKAAAPIAAPALDAPKSNRKLSNNRIQLVGYLHNSWDVTVERGTTLADVMNPEFWVHTASQLKPHDNVQVLSEDGTWIARLLVISADRLWAKMYKLEYHDLTAAYGNMPKTQEEEYEVSWTVIGKYAVLKRSLPGQPPLKDGFQTKLDAYQWLDGHLKSLNS